MINRKSISDNSKKPLSGERLRTVTRPIFSNINSDLLAFSRSDLQSIRSTLPGRNQALIFLNTINKKYAE